MLIIIAIATTVPSFISFFTKKNWINYSTERNQCYCYYYYYQQQQYQLHYYQQFIKYFLPQSFSFMKTILYRRKNYQAFIITTTIIIIAIIAISIIIITSIRHNYQLFFWLQQSKKMNLKELIFIIAVITILKTSVSFFSVSARPSSQILEFNSDYYYYN